MLEHDCDTDEDCEVYFLKPVNEYNIVDKIKEANKELFGDGDSSESLAPEQRRKVQFRVELEEYEPNTTEETNQGEKDSAENGCYELLTLDEESDDNTVPNNQTIEECAEMLAMEVQKKIEAIQIKITESDDDIEEICEEIEVMDMDTGRRLEEDTKEMNSTKSESKDSPGHKESKEDGDESAEVTDCTGELREDDDDDDDEDDKLSIIVASYLPPDPPQCDDKCSGTKKKPFSRHFSFRRRKANCRSPEIANIKMNYKTCCEYRNSEGIRLPKYSGYMSEYGLSREQLEKREQSAQSKNKVVAEKSLKATEAEVKKMQDNERAFTTWLKNKMRFPINRTKNMFDVKKANNCMVASKSGIFRQK